MATMPAVIGETRFPERSLSVAANVATDRFDDPGQRQGPRHQPRHEGAGVVAGPVAQAALGAFTRFGADRVGHLRPEKVLHDLPDRVVGGGIPRIPDLCAAEDIHAVSDHSPRRTRQFTTHPKNALYSSASTMATSAARLGVEGARS